MCLPALRTTPIYFSHLVWAQNNNNHIMFEEQGCIRLSLELDLPYVFDLRKGNRVREIQHKLAQKLFAKYANIEAAQQ